MTKKASKTRILEDTRRTHILERIFSCTIMSKYDISFNLNITKQVLSKKKNFRKIVVQNA